MISELSDPSLSPFRISSRAILLGGACTLLVCVIAAVRWGVIVGNEDTVKWLTFSLADLHEADMVTEQRSQSPTPPARVQTLPDMLSLKKLPHRLLTHSDVEFCPNITEPSADEVETIPEKLKLLMLIGTQKTGSTWLFNALYKHPSFVSTVRRIDGKDVKEGSILSKEPQYFNRWPLPPVGQYLHAWPPEVIGNMLSDVANHSVLLDASPQYLMSATAAPRIKAVAPHAKFIVIVRDAPIRTFSDYQMMIRDQQDPHPARMHEMSFFIDQVQHELNDPQWRPECYFNGSSTPVTWWDCHRCHFLYVDQKASKDECEELKRSGPPEFQDCSLSQHRFIDHGLYAAQLAWWLRFFPPDQFLILSSWQLHDKVERIKVLNRIIDFAGISGADPFTTEMVDVIGGYNGEYSREFNKNNTVALSLLRKYFRQPQKDLVQLVHTFWPEDEFHIEYETEP